MNLKFHKSVIFVYTFCVILHDNVNVKNVLYFFINAECKSDPIMVLFLLYALWSIETKIENLVLPPSSTP